jgi:hypothetical protein
MKKLVHALFFLCLVLINYSLVFGQLINPQWSKQFGGSLNEAAGFGNGSFGSPSVSVAAGENLDVHYVLSYTSSSDGYVNTNAGSEDVWLLKLNLEGDTLWTKVLGGTEAERGFHVLYEAGAVYICGRTNSNNGDFTGNNGGSDGFITKLDTDGNVLWTRLYGGTQPESFYQMIYHNGGLIVVGEAGSSDGDLSSINVGLGQAWILKVNPENGAILWQTVTAGVQQPNNPNFIENFWSIAAVPDNSGYIAVGVDGDFNDFNSDKLLINKYDLNGNKIWEKSYGSNARDWAAQVVCIQDKIYIAANAGGSGGDVSNFLGTTDLWMLELAANGDLLNEKTFGGSDLDYPYGLFVRNNQELIVTGITRSTDFDLSNSTPAGAIDAWLLVVSTDFQIQQSIRWGGSEGDFAHQMARSSDGYVVVGRTDSNDGVFNNSNGGRDLFYTKFTEMVNTVEFKKSPVRIYPNPTNDILNISVLENGFIKVLDVTGKIIHSEEIKTGNSALNVNQFPAGIYYLQFNTPFNQSTLKWVKQ